jgi:hypothetical protein
MICVLSVTKPIYICNGKNGGLSTCQTLRENPCVFHHLPIWRVDLSWGRWLVGWFLMKNTQHQMCTVVADKDPQVSFCLDGQELNDRARHQIETFDKRQIKYSSWKQL